MLDATRLGLYCDLIFDNSTCISWTHWVTKDNSTTQNNEDLQRMFEEKCTIDTQQLRWTLENIVKTHIESNPQPFMNSITLKNNDLISGGSVSCASEVYDDYEGLNIKHSEKLYSQINKYTNSRGCSNHIVMNDDTRELITGAIIPLDLRWNIIHDIIQKSIIISWSHWEKDDD